MADEETKTPQKIVSKQAGPAPPPPARSMDKTKHGGAGGSSSNRDNYSGPNDANHSLESPSNSSTPQHQYATPTSSMPQHILLNEPTPSPMAHANVGHPAALYGTPPQTPNTRRNVGRWKIGKLIGRGASGQVYMAHLVGSSAPIAVKQMQFSSHSDSEVASIQNEIDLLRGLSHRNIVRYLGTEKGDLQLNIFLEYAPGGSLRQQLNENWGKLPHERAATCTVQILSGLLYLHERGVFHRDIKGANVLVGSDGRLLLTDFGASKRVGSQSVVSGLKGTPHWMAPEVIKGQQGEDGWAKADVWSVGCTIIEMLTAQMPWSNYPNPMAAMYHIANGEKPPIGKEVEATINAECKSFIYECCCCPNPADRKAVKVLFEHPWLTEAVESAMMEDAEGSSGMIEGAMIPGPIKGMTGQGGGGGVVLAKELDNVTKAVSGGSLSDGSRDGGVRKQNGESENDIAEQDQVKAKSAKKKKKKKKERKLPKTPGEMDGEKEPKGNGGGGSAPPEMPKRPAKKIPVEEKRESRPLPIPKDDKPAKPTLQQQQEELRQMMEDQARKTLLLQQEIDAQQERVIAQQHEQQRIYARQQEMQEREYLEAMALQQGNSGGGGMAIQQPPLGQQPYKNSPRAKLRIKTSFDGGAVGAGGMQDAAPSPRWTNQTTPRGSMGRPTGAPAGQFVNNTNNSYGRRESNSMTIRQQALAELARSEFTSSYHQPRKSRMALSAGVHNACVTPSAGLSRTLPPLQQMRSHQLMSAAGGDVTSQAVPMLPLRQIASAPTKILQPVIDAVNAEKRDNRLTVAPLQNAAAGVHEAEREARRRRKEERRRRKKEG